MFKEKIFEDVYILLHIFEDVVCSSSSKMCLPNADSIRLFIQRVCLRRDIYIYIHMLRQPKEVWYMAYVRASLQIVLYWGKIIRK